MFESSMASRQDETRLPAEATTRSSGSGTRFACWYCGSGAGGKRVPVREMYFGSKESFDYIECSACRSWCIERIPEDLARHYPKEYGAHRSPHATQQRSTGLRQWARCVRTDARIGRFGAGIANRVEENYADLSPYPWRWMQMAGVGRHSAILDVGCGNGSLLRMLQAEGFNRLRGIDRFYPGETKLPGLTIGIGDVFDVQGQYDLVMLHHSLEHMPSPHEVLSRAKRLLLPGGALLVRVPLADCYAHRVYGEHWFQIDAPRHLAIPSVHGMLALARRIGMTPIAVDFDSRATQFTVSEAYRDGVSLTEQRRRRSEAGGRESRTDLDELERQAAELNTVHLGDMAAFLLRQSPSSPTA